MAFHSPWIIPFLACAFAIAAFVAGYTIAVGNKDAKAWFMYISDGGAEPPESCIFGQLLNLSSLFLAFSCYLRHRQYVVYYAHHCKDSKGWWRTVSFWLMLLGYFASFGMSMVANFQETSVATVHFIGAMIAFFGATIYCWGQIFLSYALVPHMTPLWMNHLRTLFTGFATAALMLHMVCEHLQPFVKTVNGIKPTEVSHIDSPVKYDTNSPFYTNHLVTTCAEWALALSLEAVVLSFGWELRQFYVHLPKMRIKDEYSVASVLHSDAPNGNHIDAAHVEQANGNTVKSYTVARFTNNGASDGATQEPGHYGTMLPRARLIHGDKVAPENTSRKEYMY